jgi:DNA-binding transcriptional ArsR family regulator
MAFSKKDQFHPKDGNLARYAAALAHPARIAILKTLAQQKTCVCGEIVKVMPLAQSTVSQHLKALKDAGLIQGEIKGPSSCYCINPKALKQLTDLFHGLLQELPDPKGENGGKKCC